MVQQFKAHGNGVRAMNADNLHGLINGVLPAVVELRHDLHRHPELAYEERRTARRVLEFLAGVEGLDIREGVGGTGLVVTLGRGLAGPCVALRADMDALPIEERSGVPWASQVPGRMHACGHDGHTAMLAGAVRVLAARRDLLRGPVKFLFQPAEEGGAGARRMCEEGALEDPPVAAVFGLHNNLPDPDLPAGMIAYARGAAMAGTGTFRIEVVGKGGHAAFPHRCIDPVYIGSCIVGQLQGLVSRSVDPLAPAVVSVTQFHAGTTHNIIPGTASLMGTVRALDPAVLEQLRAGVARRAADVAAAHGAQARVTWEPGYPVLVNDGRAEALFLAVMDETGDSAAVRQVGPIMGGEDFAFYSQRVPAFFYYLPACPQGRSGMPVCHHPQYDFNDALLPLGIRLHAEIGGRFALLWKD